MPATPPADSIDVGRRNVSAVLAMLTAGGCLAGCHAGRRAKLEEDLASLERRAGGSLGVCLYDPATRAADGHRMNERFGMCSTFKLALAGVILREIDQGRLRADHFVRYTRDDLLPHAPVTGANVDAGAMTVIELARAAQVTSDNPAANLLLRLIDGPAGLTAILRSLGDTETRLDRYEPELNYVPPGEQRDTTTPLAMARTVADLVLGEVLSPASRELLFGWMRETATGLSRLRAGFPDDWTAGDKTGTAFSPGTNNRYNDIAVVAPPGRSAFVVTAYYQADGEYGAIRARDEEVLAEVGAIAAATR